MLERQREGIAKAKAEGKFKGRVPTARRQADKIQALAAEGLGPVEITKRLEISRSSVWRVLAQKVDQAVDTGRATHQAGKSVTPPR